MITKYFSTKEEMLSEPYYGHKYGADGWKGAGWYYLCTWWVPQYWAGPFNTEEAALSDAYISFRHMD